MARFEDMLDRLPSVYRPEKDDPGLLPQTLRAVASVLEDLNRESSDVLQSHWFGYADSALYSPFAVRGRELQGLGHPDPADEAVSEFPYVHDLARLAALLALAPVQEPPSIRETVEEYRRRIQRIVALYRDGLGTVYAMRRMVEARLPLDLQAPPERQDRPFWLEEFAPLVEDTLAVPARGEPVDMVGPLMRWTVTNDGMEAAPPTLYIGGVEPQEGRTVATTNPLVELYRDNDALPRLGIAYRGEIESGRTLRLRPAYESWIGLDDGVERSLAVPGETNPADPTAPGPWQRVAGAPEEAVADIRQTQDRTLWVAVNTGEGGALHRFDGQGWSLALSGLPNVRCLAENNQDLLLGTDAGLLRMPLYPDPAGDFGASPVPGTEEEVVHALFRAADGLLWLGTGGGVARLEGGVIGRFGVGESEDTSTEVYAINEDRTGTLYFGTELGLFQYQPSTDHWYWYRGEERTEQAADWEPFSPAKEGDARNFPTAARVFLPPVRCVHRGPDSSLWIGTDSGVARYVALDAGGLAYTTLLEAFPDLTVGRVFAIEEDERGLVWFCTDRGLFRYDGRDLWQYREGEWARLGRAGESTAGAWRFERSESRWQRFDARTSDWVSFTDEPRTEAQPAARVVTWIDGVSADLGEWDGTRFADPVVVAAADLLVRYKPREDRIVTGGVPAVPRLPVGFSDWRYLSLEPEDPEEPEDHPSWTIEGRLLPPPPERAAPEPARYDLPPPVGAFDEAVFAFAPAARVTLAWRARRPLSALARLKRRSGEDHIDPAILDRVWQGIQTVRPAGIRAALAVEEAIVRGGSDG